MTFVLGLSSSLFAASGASFLKLGVGARALGLGSAYTAVAADSTALYWNPAGLAAMSRKELSATHARMFSDSQYNFMAYAHPTKKASWGASALYLSQGEIEGRGEGREKTSDFTASDLAVTLGTGRRVTGRTSLGAGLKLIQSKIANYSSTGFALDLGAQYKADFAPVNFGFAVQNLGPEVKFLQESYSLPLTVSAGASYSLAKSLLLSADLKHYPKDSRTAAGFGAEVSIASMISLRSGYAANAARSVGRQNSGSDKFSGLSGFDFGLGFKLGSSTVDYSFSPAGELGNSQRLSLSVRFR